MERMQATTNPTGATGARKEGFMPSTPTFTFFAFEASETGALPGHGCRCSDCGYVGKTSLSEREARQLAAQHAAWHRRKAGAK